MTKLGREIEIGDVVYVAHARTKWVKVAEVVRPRRDLNKNTVWIRQAASAPWLWLAADEAYPVKT